MVTDVRPLLLSSFVTEFLLVVVVTEVAAVVERLREAVVPSAEALRETFVAAAELREVLVLVVAELTGLLAAEPEVAEDELRELDVVPDETDELREVPVEPEAAEDELRELDVVPDETDELRELLLAVVPVLEPLFT